MMNRRGACGGLTERSERRQPPARASAATIHDPDLLEAIQNLLRCSERHPCVQQ